MQIQKEVVIVSLFYLSLFAFKKIDILLKKQRKLCGVNN